MTPARWLATLGLLILLGCAGGGATDTSSPEPVEQATTTTAKPCDQAPPNLLAAIAGGAKEGTGMTLTRGAVVRSTEHQEAYYVAAEMSGPGFNGDLGVWTTNRPDGSSGFIMSVDALAQRFTVWPDAGSTDAEMKVTDAGAQAALACLG